MTLTARQERFVAEYVICLNASQAALKAGYSENGAEVTGCKLLKNPKVAAAIAAKQAAVAERLELTAEGVLSDLADLQAKATEAGNFSAAIRAAELRGKHLGIFTDKVDLNVGGSVTHELVRGRARAAKATRPDS